MISGFSGRYPVRLRRGSFIVLVIARTGTAAFAFAFGVLMGLRVRAVHHKAGAAVGIVHEVNVCAAQVVNRNLVNNKLYAIGLEGDILVANIIFERHAEVRSTAPAPGDEHP